MISIRAKLLSVLLIMALVPLLSLGAVNYYQTTEIFTKSIQGFLFTIVKSKEDALENFIEGTIAIGQSIAETDAVQTYITYLGDEESNRNSIAFKAAESQIENILYSFQKQHWGKYHHIFIIDRSKKIVLSPNYGVIVKGSPSSHLNESTADNKWAMKALFRGQIAVSDYSSWVESDHSHQMLFFPIKDELGIAQAVIGFELQIPHEEKILTENFELGKTGKVFLTTTEGVPIVYKDIGKQEPLNTSGILEAQARGYSTGRRLNQDGVEVIDLYLKHDKYPWILVAEIEAEEAFSGLLLLQTTLLAGLVITLVFALILSLLFAGFIVNPIRKLTGQMEEISLGNMETPIENLDRKDEIGHLVQAFHRIVVSLKIAMGQIKNNKGND